MLTGADLDTMRTLQWVLVQIKISSQTKTSRQIACANVIGVTSAHEKKKESKEGRKNTLPTLNFIEFSVIFSSLL